MLPRQQSLVTGRPGTQNEGGASPSMRGIVGFINQIVEGSLLSYERLMEAREHYSPTNRALPPGQAFDVSDTRSIAEPAELDCRWAA